MNGVQNTFTKIKLEYIFIIIFIFIILIVLFNCSIMFTSEHFNNKIVNTESINRIKTKWSRNTCEYLISDTLNDEIKNNGMIQSENDWNLFFPCGYDNIKNEVNRMPVVNNAKYFIIENCDEIVAKELLWKHIVSHFDYPIAKTMMPNGYIMYDTNDMIRFEKEYDPSKIYIMKKNIQRQEGLKITKNKHEILKGFENEGYVLVQELLQNPYTISGRKTNMRFYILVVCKSTAMNVFVYKDGFMYYTKDMFKTGSTEEGPNITTGYIERQVYIDNPLTHQDLRMYLDDTNRKNLSEIEQSIRNQNIKISEIYFSRIYHLIRQVFIAFQGKLTKSTKFNDTNIMFQLFGADIAVDDKLNPTIMEINKGPDLDAKDERDSALKHELVRNMFKIIDTSQMENCNETMFLKVLDINNGMINIDNKAICSL